MQKFLKVMLQTFQNPSEIKYFIEKMILTKEAKIQRLQKIFLLFQKFLHEGAKNSFLQPRKLGLGLH